MFCSKQVFLQASILLLAILIFWKLSYNSYDSYDSTTKKKEGFFGSTVATTAVDSVTPVTPVYVIHYYASWCPHSLAMKPIWEQVKREIASRYSSTMSVIAVDHPCDDEIQAQAAQKAGIRGYPTILVVQNGHPQQEYQGERSVQGLMSFIDAYYNRH